MRKTIFIMTVFFVFMASSCKEFYNESFDISDEECITLQLPSWPPSDPLQSSYPPLSKWVVSLESENCSTTFSCPATETGIVSSTVSKNGISLSGSHITFSVKKNKPASITLQPVTQATPNTMNSDPKEIIFFKQAGFIYPYNFASSESAKSNNITWNQGFIATLMQNIFKIPDYKKSELNNFISSFNWKKASEIINDKINNISEPYNPWLLNQQRIIEKICNKTITSIYFNQSSTDEVPISSLPLKNNSSQPQFLSSFIPENKNLASTEKILLKKYQPTLIYTSKNTGIICTYSSIKKISLEYILLPIYIEGI